jgi:threonine dehydratase
MTERSTVTADDVRAARERIAGEITATPCRRAHSSEALLDGGGRLYLKLENLHRTGSFKERGALNRLALMSEEERRRGVIAASAGNHAQALALHATRLGVAATVVMPEHTPLVKVGSARRYGAEVVLHGESFDDAVAEARHRRDAEGLVLVPAFDDPRIVAGQGTIGLELLEQLEAIDLVVVPIGGGGLISGIAVALKEARPALRVIGVEAEAAPSARASRDAGRIVATTATDTIADGIAVKRVGEVTFPLIERYVDEIVLVSEEEIAAAVLLLLEREKTLAEGAGAAAMAALAARKVPVAAGDVAVAVIGGGNIDINMLSRIIDRGLVADGRLVRLEVAGRDRPGLMARLTSAVARCGANVLEIAHHREFADIKVGEVEIVFTLETRGPEHVEEAIAALEADGRTVTRLD